VAGAADYTAIAWSSRGALALAGNGAVSVVRAVGRKPQRLPAAAGATEVVWNPAGTTLGFSSPGAGGPVISAVAMDGTGLRMLAEGDRLDWSARG
jgi:hypothetical protein